MRGVGFEDTWLYYLMINAKTLNIFVVVMCHCASTIPTVVREYVRYAFIFSESMSMCGPIVQNNYIPHKSTLDALVPKPPELLVVDYTGIEQYIRSYRVDLPDLVRDIR
jgi:hypothetical protein